MRTELITIGDEILAGRTLDTNSNYIARELQSLGLPLCQITTGSDKLQDLTRILREVISRADIVITIGGLGPTPDDRLREAMAEALRLPLEENTEAACMLLNYKFNNPQGYTKQVRMPEGAVALRNMKGVAPGVYLNVKGNKHIFCLPGVPNEMKDMFKKEVRRILVEKVKITPPKIFLLRTTGICEVDMLSKVTDSFPDLADRIAFYPSYEGVDLRIVDDEQAYKQCKKLFEPYIYTEEQKDLSETVGDLLRQRSLTLSVAESCSGGLISSRIVDIPGSSDYYLGGVISYSNQTKIELLKVEKDLLKKFGAVSTQVAKSMAEGCRKKFGSDYSLSTTGIAGPTGGSREKPIGLVYIGLARRGKNSYIRKYRFKGTRQMVRRKSAQSALFMLFLELEDRLKGFPFADGSEEGIL